MGFCTFFVVPLVALLATGLVKVDVTPLFYASGRLLPEYVPQADGKPLVVPNKDIRAFLEKAGLKGGMDDKSSPLRGLYMFHLMGPVGWIDFSYASWDSAIQAAEIDMRTITVQSGVPTPEFGGIGPFVPGGYMVPLVNQIKYKVRFYCPKQMKDGDYCNVVESLFGKPMPAKEDPPGPMLWHMTQFDGGRKYVRDTWLVPPWATPDKDYVETHGKAHKYELLVLMHPNRTIDEDNFQQFMKKLDGQDLIVNEALAGFL